MSGNSNESAHWNQVAEMLLGKHHLDELPGEHEWKVHLALIAKWADVTSGRVILKTDLFEEAFGAHHFLFHLRKVNYNVVVMDRRLGVFIVIPASSLCLILAGVLKASTPVTTGSNILRCVMLETCYFGRLTWMLTVVAIIILPRYDACFNRRVKERKSKMHILSSPFHPQTNGKLERYRQPPEKS